MARNTPDMPGADRDEESGKYVEKYPVEKFIEALRELDGGSTSDVEEAVGCSYQLAYDRLRGLEKEGRITSDRVGNARYWQVADIDEAADE